MVKKCTVAKSEFQRLQLFKNVIIIDETTCYMKILFGSSAVFVLMFVISFEGGLTSCTKDHTIYDTVRVEKRDTVTVRDTLTISDTLVTEAILTANPWKLLELRAVNEGTILYYLRGGSSNTDNYDFEYYVFNPDHTGYEMDNAGIAHNISQWTLSNPDNPKLTCTYYVNATTTMLLTWDNLRFKNKSLYYDEYYSNPIVGNDFHGQGIRIVK